MIRQIKFRAWDKTSLVMIVGMKGDWYIRPDGKPVSIDREGEEEKIPDYEIMQFTGLKDKNGKEIYESDIIGCNDDPPMVVRWNDSLACWGMSFFRNNRYSATTNIPSNCFVAGNIHENMSLLKS